MVSGERREGGTSITLLLKEYSSEPGAAFSRGELQRWPRLEGDAPGKDDRRREAREHNAKYKVEPGRTLVLGEAATFFVSRVRPASEVLLGGRGERDLLLGGVVRYALPIVRKSRL